MQPHLPLDLVKLRLKIVFSAEYSQILYECICCDALELEILDVVAEELLEMVFANEVLDVFEEGGAFDLRNDAEVVVGVSVLVLFGHQRLLRHFEDCGL